MEEEIVDKNPFEYGVKTNKKSDSARQKMITLSESQDLFNSQYCLRDLARAYLARFMGFRAASDSIRLRNRDVNFAEGDCSRASVLIDSVKNGRRECPLFCDGVYIIVKLLCDAEPNPNGFLFNGEAKDKIRAGGVCDLSLATQFGDRYVVYARRETIPKLFTNLRSTCVRELVKIFGFDKHSVGRWLGHVEHIQDEHYLQMMDEDYAASMSNLFGRKINPSGPGSYLSEMVFIALHRNLPELVEAAT